MKQITLSLILFLLIGNTIFSQEIDYTKNDKKDLTWFKDAKFGMMVVWGLYSVLEGNYKGKETEGIAEWIYKREKIPAPEYEALRSKFNAVKFEAEQWAKAAKNAGMKYLIITTKHHDGFCLFDSEVSSYDIKTTAYNKDVIKELQLACEKYDLKLSLYYSILDWHHKDASYRSKKKNYRRYIDDYFKPQIKELLGGNYGNIDLVWFDGGWEDWWTSKMGKEMYNYIYKISPNTIINERLGSEKLTIGDYITPEQNIPGVPSKLREGDIWETVMTLNNTWGYKAGDDNWKTPKEVIRTLIEVASRGGILTMNVGPTGEGEIPVESLNILEKVGQWMAVNKDAIYGTKASPFGVMPWGRITATKNKLFFHVFDYPRNQLNVRVGEWKSRKIKSVRALSHPNRQLNYLIPGSEIRIELPITKPDEIATVIEIEFEEEKEEDKK